MLPNFLVIGAMKAGTTALYGYLRQHPQVFMAEPKELDFFVHHWDKGVPWYEAHFAGAGDALAVGEASPNYTKVHDHPEVPGRIAAVAPHAKLIYIVREPIDRIVSMYRQVVVDGLEIRPLADAVAANTDYVNTSRYARQLQAFLEHFPQDQILVLRSEDLAAAPGPTLRSVYGFLGIENRPVPAIGADANVGTDRRAPRRWANALSNLGPYHRLLERSWRARAAHQRLGTRPASPAAPEVPDELRRWLEERLAKDKTLLLELTGIEW